MLDFSDRHAVAIYAPSGTMKTSFARTFKDLAAGDDSVDRVFSDREFSRSITDENSGTEQHLRPNARNSNSVLSIVAAERLTGFMVGSRTELGTRSQTQLSTPEM